MESSVNYYQLLEELQIIQFVLVELNLYLNTHPHDKDAIDQFNQFAKEHKQLVKRMEKKFDPIYNFGLSKSDTPWEWQDQPWPWQV